VRAAGPIEAARKQLARDLLAEIRDADQRLTMLTSTIAATVAEQGSQLPTVEGIGPIIAGRRSSLSSWSTWKFSRVSTAAGDAQRSPSATTDCRSRREGRATRLATSGDRSSARKHAVGALAVGKDFVIGRQLRQLLG
jgi:hypothetical protein